MSRMLAWIAPDALLSGAQTLGTEALESFLALARLHADGWGAATAADTASVALATGTRSPGSGIRHAAAHPARSGILYLRFASAGSAVHARNLQPFAHGRFAFAHNGALLPRSALWERLAPPERAALGGDTDSEVYAAFVRHALASAPHGSAPETVLARAVSEVRALYPAACLNALAMHEGALLAVHAPGTVAPPLAAFAARGVSGDALPPGHDAGYNVLRTALLPSGARAVASTGVTGADWQPLPVNTVTRFGSGGHVVTAPLLAR